MRDERVRDRALLLHLHRMPGAQALPIARQCLRLCTVDAHVRRERLDRRGDAADEPAAADRDNDRVGRRALGENLEPDRALPRHDERVVKRRHHRRAALGAEPRRNVKALSSIAQHELRAQRADGRLLDGGRGLRHDDAGVRAEALRGVGHRAAVVSGRGRDKAARTLILRQGEDLVHRAAQLERACALHALGLGIHLAAEGIVERRQAQQRRPDNIRGNARVRRPNGLQCQLHGNAPFSTAPL